MLIILALSIFLKPVFPVLEYIANYDYIVKELCENKEKPELQCNGKCQLMKEMAKAAEDEKPISSDKKENNKNIEILFYSEIDSLVSTKLSFSIQSKISNHYSNLYSYKTSFSIFHPPAVTS